MSHTAENGWFYLDDNSAVLVHADGGDCHGTPLVHHRCPVCGISPDMQSTEFWPLDQIKTPHQRIVERRQLIERLRIEEVSTFYDTHVSAWRRLTDDELYLLDFHG